MKKIVTILAAAACMAACSNAQESNSPADANTSVGTERTTEGVQPASVDTTPKADSARVEKALKK